MKFEPFSTEYLAFLIKIQETEVLEAVLGKGMGQKLISHSHPIPYIMGWDGMTLSFLNPIRENTSQEKN